MSVAPQNSQNQPRGWWSRNWKWFVPVGCILPILVCCGGGTGIFLYGLNTIKSDPGYQQALATAKADPRVKEALGEPITEDFVPQLQLLNSNGTESLKLTVGLKGPKGSGTLDALGQKIDGKWVYSKLDFTPSGGGQRIELLAKKDDKQ
jgi:Cytochrome oxidase complex assembly protein 1